MISLIGNTVFGKLFESILIVTSLTRLKNFQCPGTNAFSSINNAWLLLQKVNELLFLVISIVVISFIKAIDVSKLV